MNGLTDIKCLFWGVPNCQSDENGVFLRSEPVATAPPSTLSKATIQMLELCRFFGNAARASGACLDFCDGLPNVSGGFLVCQRFAEDASSIFLPVLLCHSIENHVDVKH